MRWIVLAAFALGAPGQEEASAPLRLAGDDLLPGLAAVYRDAKGASIARIDPKPAFTVRGSSLHPRLAPGPFEAIWEGVFAQPEPGPIRFGAFVRGHVKATLGGATILDGRGDSETSWIQMTAARVWPPGLHRIRIEFRSLADGAARIQLGWEGEAFSREPMPAWRFKHLPGELPGAFARDERSERGRLAAERLGCARCHRGAFPSADEILPGPSLAGAEHRLDRAWLLRWLEDPNRVRKGARMPSLFPSDRPGFVDRWIVADHLLRNGRREEAPGDVRQGRKAFLGVGCAACHPVPDIDLDEQGRRERIPLQGLGDRFTSQSLAAFLENPHARYADGRMPRQPITPGAARDLSAFLLAASPAPAAPGEEPPTADELSAAALRWKTAGTEATAKAVLQARRCAQCHAGLDAAPPLDVPIVKREGCLAGRGLPRFDLDPETRAALEVYLEQAGRETHASSFESGKRRLRHQGCLRCHTRDSDRPPPIEEIGSELAGGGEASLYQMPFQRTPRLTQAHARYRRDYLLSAVRSGVSGVRAPWYSYKMPAFGAEAEAIVRALAETDGDLPDAPEPPVAVSTDPTLAGAGPALVGYEGYSCISCHLWKGRSVAEVEHGSVGPELTSVTQRVRRDWFDRWLEEPSRSHPGTPMPQIFKKGQAATVQWAFEGDAARQKEAFWSYFARGKEAADPRSLPPTPVEAPAAGEPPKVALIPVHLADKTLVEGLCVLFNGHDALVFDVGSGAPRDVYTGARLLRVPKDRRSFLLTGMPAGLKFPREAPPSAAYAGFDRLADGIRVRWSSGLAETLRIEGRTLIREVQGKEMRHDLPPAQAPPAAAGSAARLTDPGIVDPAGRPGYRLTTYPRPKTPLGEDDVMPGAIVADPRSGKVFVASMKRGDLFTIDEAEGREPRFVNYAGLFQDAYSMAHDGEWLYVLHRRNLTRIRDADGDGRADTFERVAALAHSVGENVDNAYGLVREPDGSFVFTHAVNTPKPFPGWGSAMRLGRDGARAELAFGLRRAYGWALGPEDSIFFTDNQGEWVASNKLCHVAPGRYFGYPNPGQNHAGKPAGKAAVWIPYGWARSTNGLVLDATGGKFGPFAGQFFMAEMMYGGGILRASVEKVNGEYQGACYPFWSRGLVGPLVVAFDPKGRLYVGAITDASCGSQPDRGAVFRIDFTGEVPFEIQEVRVRPRGFRLRFTRRVDPAAASRPESYALEHFRYEYTGAYGSPELDRTRVSVEEAVVSADGLTVDLATSPLVKDRVYMIAARGIRSPQGESLVHPAAAYTLNEVP